MSIVGTRPPLIGEVSEYELHHRARLGLFTSGVGRSVYRGKVHALKMEAIRSIMKIFFQIRMESRILGIPNEEIAPQKDNPTYISNEAQPEIRDFYDEWLVAQTEKVRAYIDDVKFQNAINTAKMAIKDRRFEKCSKKIACTHKQYVKSVRCLNRAYRLGQDHAVLESLGCAYHLLAIHDALKEDHTIEIEKVDRSSLYKARECFLILLDKADELYLRAMMKREGGILYDTFFFEQDNYRILTLYPILIKNSPDDAKMKRDFEMKYAKTVCQSGQIDLTQFHHLTKADKILLSILKEEQDALHRLDFTNSEDLRRISNLDKKLYNVIDKVEQNLEQIDEKEQLLVRALLLNLYRWGKYLFGWNIIFNMERHLEFIQKNGKEEMAITFENFIYECSHEPEEAEAEIPAIIGEPMLIQSLIDGFKNYIVRPDDLEKMMEI